MKRAYFWLIILTLIIVSLNNEESIEISDRSIIHAVGIDESEEGVTVTMQVFKSSGAGAETQLDQSKPNFVVISNTAESFDQAIILCENQLGNKLFVGHNQIIVLGKEVNMENPQELLGYFVQDKKNYLGVDVVIAENTAKELLEVELNVGIIAAENFSEVIDMYFDNGETVRSDMLYFLNSLPNGEKTGVVPVLSIRESSNDNYVENNNVALGENKISPDSKSEISQADSSSKDDKSSQENNSSSEVFSSQDDTSKPSESSSDSPASSTSESSQQSSPGSDNEEEREKAENAEPLIVIEKAAIVNNGKIVGYLQTSEITGVSWMTKKLDRVIMNIKIDDTMLGISVKQRKTKTKLEKIENRLVYKVDIKATILTQDNALIGYDKDDIKKKVEEEIVASCEAATEIGYRELNCDIYNIMLYIRHSYPQIYLDNEDNLKALIPYIDFDVSATCYIR